MVDKIHDFLFGLNAGGLTGAVSKYAFLGIISFVMLLRKKFISSIFK